MQSYYNLQLMYFADNKWNPYQQVAFWDNGPNPSEFVLKVKQEHQKTIQVDWKVTVITVTIYDDGSTDAVESFNETIKYVPSKKVYVNGPKKDQEQLNKLGKKHAKT